METTNNTHQQASDLARTLLIVSNYEWLQQEAAAVGVDIIPLKGIDLLQTLYAERLDRPVRDIDLLVPQGADALRRLAERLCREDYRLEFPFALRPEALDAKKKVSLLSCSTTKVNVDLHTAFVTKKFFARTVGTFNADAVSRCKDGRMESLDRWLFLAQHAAFHAFGDGKWSRDLRLLYDAFSPEQRSALVERSRQYGFRRVLMATLQHIYRPGLPASGQAPQPLPTVLSPNAAERRFLCFLRHYDRPMTRNAADRLVTSYWEFLFIARRRDRLRAWLRLLFPTPGMLTNIYRIRRPAALLLYYPLNVLIAGFTSLLFAAVYLTRSITG